MDKGMVQPERISTDNEPSSAAPCCTPVPRVLSQEEVNDEMLKLGWCPDCGGVIGRCNCSI